MTMKTHSLSGFSFRMLGVALAVVAAGAPIAPGAVSAQQDPADLILRSGRVWTGDSTAPWAEGVAIAGDTIAAVGSRRAIARS